MKILAIEKELSHSKPENYKACLKEEASAVWNLYVEGIIRELYFRADVKCAVLLLECQSVEDARTIISDLPIVKNKLSTFDIIPLVPYDGFERLFEQVG